MPMRPFLVPSTVTSPRMKRTRMPRTERSCPEVDDRGYAPAMDLSRIEELAVIPEAPDRVRVSWRQGRTWESYDFVANDSGYADDEDILWWLLRSQAPVELVRSAMAVPFPDFDLDAAIDQATMPDREERRAEDQANRARLKEEFRAHRGSQQ